jgi:signal transduction histidine kinase
MGEPQFLETLRTQLPALLGALVAVAVLIVLYVWIDNARRPRGAFSQAHLELAFRLLHGGVEMAATGLDDSVVYLDCVEGLWLRNLEPEGTPLVIEVKDGRAHVVRGGHERLEPETATALVQAVRDEGILWIAGSEPEIELLARGSNHAVAFAIRDLRAERYYLVPVGPVAPARRAALTTVLRTSLDVAAMARLHAMEAANLSDLLTGERAEAERQGKRKRVALSAFDGDIHNLKNAVNLLTGNAQMLIDMTREHASVAGDSQVTAVMEAVEASLVRIFPMVNRSQSIAKRMMGEDIPPAQVESLAVNQLFSSYFSAQLQRNRNNYGDIDFTVAIPEGLYIRANPQYFYEVVWNLLLNAITYTRNHLQQQGLEEGLITVRAEATADGMVRLDITDTGPGISPEHLAKIGTSGFRGAQPPVDGRGIGLWMSRQMMAEIGGRIEIASTLGKGSTFSLFFQGVQNEEPTWN